MGKAKRQSEAKRRDQDALNTGTAEEQGAVDKRQDRAVALLENRVKRGEWWIIGLTAATVIIGAMQWYLTREQAALAESSAAIDQRAWVNVRVIEGTPAMGCQFIPSVTIQNTGKTPALHLEASMRLLRLKRGESVTLKNTDFPYKRNENGADSTALLPAGGEFTVSEPLPDPVTQQPIIITQTMVEEFNRGDYVLFVLGYVTYRDIFRRSHWLQFCGEYKDGKFSVCKDGNNIDEP